MKTSFWKSVQVLAISLSMLLPVGAEAASAQGRVSANIVASATADLSGAIVISKQSPIMNSSSVNLSTAGMKESTLKVTSSYNMHYDVSISSPATVRDSAGQKVTVEQLQISSENNQTHNISGTFTKNNRIMLVQNAISQPDADPFADAISITVNYN